MEGCLKPLLEAEGGKLAAAGVSAAGEKLFESMFVTAGRPGEPTGEEKSGTPQRVAPTWISLGRALSKPGRAGLVEDVREQQARSTDHLGPVGKAKGAAS
jgi:hypothetical protein